MTRRWPCLICVWLILALWLPCIALGDGVVEEPAYAPLTLAYWQLESIQVHTPQTSSGKAYTASAAAQAQEWKADGDVTALRQALEQIPSLTLEITKRSNGAYVCHTYTLEGLEALFKGGGTLRLSARATPESEDIPTTALIAVNGRRIVRVSANGASKAKDEESVEFAFPAITRAGQEATISLIAQDEAGAIKASIIWTFVSREGSIPTPTPVPTPEPTPVPTPAPHFEALTLEGDAPEFYKAEGNGVYSLEDAQGNRVYRVYGSLDGAQGAFVPSDETGAVLEETDAPADLTRDERVAAGEMTLIQTGEVEPTPTPVPTPEPTPVPTPAPHFEALTLEGDAPEFYKAEGNGVYSLEDVQGNRVYRVYGSLDGAQGAFVPSDETGAVLEETDAPADLTRDERVAAGEITLIQTGEVEPTPTPVPTPEPTATPAPQPLIIFTPWDANAPQEGGYTVTYTPVEGKERLYQIEIVDGRTFYRVAEEQEDGTILLLPADEEGNVVPDAKPVDTSVDARLSDTTQWIYGTPEKIATAPEATEAPEEVITVFAPQEEDAATAFEAATRAEAVTAVEAATRAEAATAVEAATRAEAVTAVEAATQAEAATVNEAGIVVTTGEGERQDAAHESETLWPGAPHLTPVEGIPDLFSMETIDGGKIYRKLVTKEDGTLALVEADEQGNVSEPALPLSVLDDRRALMQPAPTLTPEPTQEPTAEPTAKPTPVPTAEPTPIPTQEPTAEPTQAPTDEPTAEVTAIPTATPEAASVMAQFTPEHAQTEDVNPAATDAPQPSQSNSFPWWIPVVIVLILVAVGLFFVLRKR